MSQGGTRTAVVLLSGGLDSSVALAIAKAEGFSVHALTVDYGQRHNRELDAARAMARHQGVDHKVVRVDLSAFGGSALTDAATPVPHDTPEDEIGETIPSTYVPARNTVFIAVAMAWAEALDADAVFIGANAVDYSGYPDCHPEFIDAMQRVADLGTRRGVEGTPIDIVAPILRETKAGIVMRGMELGVPFHLTWSCYRGRPRACGRCDSCRLRLRGFAEAGAEDPLEYEEGVEIPAPANPGNPADPADPANPDPGNPGPPSREDGPPLGSPHRPIIAELVEEGALEEDAGPLPSRGGGA